jgi:ADP-heptose:LPS heptosyltransferase
LKVGPDFDQIKIPPNEIKNLGSQITDFQDTAEAVSCLDLVITVDTSIAHLAGAMGKPVWVLLPFAPDWRWMLESDGSPWYQSMRLFRQQQLGEWSYPFQRISEALEVLSTKKQCNDELKFNA